MWLLKQLDVFTDSFIGQTELSFGLECLHPQQVDFTWIPRKTSPFYLDAFFSKAKKGLYCCLLYLTQSKTSHVYLDAF